MLDRRFVVRRELGYIRAITLSEVDGQNNEYGGVSQGDYLELNAVSTGFRLSITHSQNT